MSRRGACWAPRPRPRAVDRFLGSQSQRMGASACSPPPPSSSPLLHGGYQRPPLVAASLGNDPPAFIGYQVPPGVGVDAATWGKGPRESSGGAMGRGGGPRCLALQFCLPACLMSFPSYVPSRLRDFPPAANAVAGGALEVVSTSLTRGARHPAAAARGGHGGGLPLHWLDPPPPPHGLWFRKRHFSCEMGPAPRSAVRGAPFRGCTGGERGCGRRGSRGLLTPFQIEPRAFTAPQF